MTPLRPSRVRFLEFIELYRRTAGAPKGSAPARPDHAPVSPRQTLLKCFRLFHSYKAQIGVIVLLALVSIACKLYQPLAARTIIDSGLTNAGVPAEEKLRTIAIHGSLALGLLMLAVAIDVAQGVRLSVVNAKVVASLKRRVFRHVLRLPLFDLATMKTGSILSRITSDTSAINHLVERALITPLVETLRLTITIIVMASINWRLAVVGTLLIPPMFYLSIAVIKKLQPIHRHVQRENNRVNGDLGEVISGVKVVRTYRREKFEELNYAMSSHMLVRAGLFVSFRQILFDTMMTLLTPLILLLLVCAGGVFAVSGHATIGDMTAAMMYVTALFEPIIRIVNAQSQIGQSVVSAEQVFWLLDKRQDKPDRPDALPAPTVVRDIHIDRVGFEFCAGEPVLSDVSLHVRAGMVVALVGKSGAGKSTLTNLIARVYDPTSGAIRVNGADIRNFKLLSFRRLISMVDQDVFLFGGSIRENIAFSSRLASESEIIAAAKKANAHEFIERLPQKYDTLVGERGVRLSGGQRQRISIARAFLAGSQILILDEATSALDTESEQQIQAATSELIKNRTTFVVAHRLSTIFNADIIMVLDRGSIREVGSHRELMARDGMYREMIARQFGVVLEHAEWAGLARHNEGPCNYDRNNGLPAVERCA